MELSNYIVYLCAAHRPETIVEELQEKLTELYGQVQDIKRKKDNIESDMRTIRARMDGFVVWVRKSMNDGHLDLDDIESFSDYKHLSEYCLSDEAGDGLGLTPEAFEELLKTGSVNLNELTSTVFTYDYAKSTFKVTLEIHPDDEPFQTWEDGDDE